MDFQAPIVAQKNGTGDGSSVIITTAKYVNYMNSNDSFNNSLVGLRLSQQSLRLSSQQL